MQTFGHFIPHKVQEFRGSFALQFEVALGVVPRERYQLKYQQCLQQCLWFYTMKAIAMPASDVWAELLPLLASAFTELVPNQQNIVSECLAQLETPNNYFALAKDKPIQTLLGLMRLEQ